LPKIIFVFISDWCNNVLSRRRFFAETPNLGVCDIGWSRRTVSLTRVVLYTSPSELYDKSYWIALVMAILNPDRIVEFFSFKAIWLTSRSKAAARLAALESIRTVTVCEDRSNSIFSMV
jgi:hypothetical protein